MINPYAIGKTIYLRAPVASDIEPNWYQWFSDPEVTRFLGERVWPNTVELQREFFESTKNANDRLVLCICRIEDDSHIGICNISFINWIHRFGDVALIVGDKKYRNGSAAEETLALMLEIAFVRLNLLNLRSSHLAGHPHTPLLVKLFGFQEVGRIKNLYHLEGSQVDFVTSQLSREDWYSRNQSAKTAVMRDG